MKCCIYLNSPSLDNLDHCVGSQRPELFLSKPVNHGLKTSLLFTKASIGKYTPFR